jgi:hypothetical protein
MRDPPSADLAAGISTPCNGRSAQEQEASARTKAPVARSRRAVLTLLRESQDNSQRPGIDQSMDFLIRFAEPECFSANKFWHIDPDQRR